MSTDASNARTKQVIVSKSAGREPIRCPFHVEQNSGTTCVVDHKALSWQCFGCGRRGTMSRARGSVFVQLTTDDDRREE